MSFNYWSTSLEDIHRVLMMTLDDDYDYLSAPRGKPIKELVGASFTLSNPRHRIITSPARNVNYGFGVGELCWYVRGDSDLETMLYYNKRMAQFSDDGKTINSAYGNRMFRNRFRENQFSGSGHDAWDRSQLDNVLEELRKDPDSRRAVMHINEPPDLDRATTAGSKDVPCTLSIQLLIRERKLHMVVNMRSNDVVWGLPYDVFSFTCLQEAFLYMLQERGVPVDDLGTYNHHAGSLHIYDTHFEMAKQVAKEDYVYLDPMQPFTLAGLQHIAEQLEPDIRTGKGAAHVWLQPGVTETWMVNRLYEHRLKRISEERRRDEALTQLVRITEEAGGYPELEQEKK